MKVFGDLDCMLLRDKGFHVYCDQSNPIQIFSPDKEVKQHVKAKLQRWALKLVGCRYVIHHITGERSLWADIISRWDLPVSPEATEPLAVRPVTMTSSHTLYELRLVRDHEFPWLTRPESVRVLQQNQGDASDGAVETSDGIQLDVKLWRPSKAKALLKRLFVVNLQGHGGANAIVELLGRRFALTNARQTISRFINRCLLYKHVMVG